MAWPRDSWRTGSRRVCAAAGWRSTAGPWPLRCCCGAVVSGGRWLRDEDRGGDDLVMGLADVSLFSRALLLQLRGKRSCGWCWKGEASGEKEGTLIWELLCKGWGSSFERSWPSESRVWGSDNFSFLAERKTKETGRSGFSFENGQKKWGKWWWLWLMVEGQLFFSLFWLQWCRLLRGEKRVSGRFHGFLSGYALRKPKGEKEINRGFAGRGIKEKKRLSLTFGFKGRGEQWRVEGNGGNNRIRKIKATGGLCAEKKNFSGWQRRLGVKKNGFRVSFPFLFIKIDPPPIDFCRLLFIGKAFFRVSKLVPQFFNQFTW